MSASYYRLRFWTATAQTGPFFFLYWRHSMRLTIISIGACATKFCWCGIEMNKVCWMHSCSSLCDIFRTGTALASLLLLTQTMPFHRRSHITLHTSDLFSGIHKFVFHQVYYANKGLFLGLFSSPWFAYMGRYRDVIYCALVNYAEIFYDLRY